MQNDSQVKSQWKASAGGAVAQEISAEVAAVFSNSGAVFIFDKNKDQHSRVLSVGRLSRLPTPDWLWLEFRLINSIMSLVAPLVPRGTFRWCSLARPAMKVSLN